MMKFLLPLLAVVGFASPALAQKTNHLPHEIATKPKIGTSNIGTATAPAVPAAKARSLEQLLCTQKYDLQTYNSMPNRVYNYGGGTISAGWMFADDENAWPDRGTGCNNNKNGGSWGTYQRVEGNGIRSGFPSFTGLANGTDVAIAHQNTDAPPFKLRLMRRKANETTWSASFLPIDALPNNTGYVWPVITSGGADGNALHVIAVNNAPDAARSLYYFRSQDGGTTWDISEKLISGLDTSWLSVDAHAYHIDARGTTVAIGVFDSWGDVTIMKSTDNGTTWKKHIALDFPLDNYIADSGYSEADIKTKHEGLANQPLAMYTADGSGAVHIDNNGKVHAFFGDAFVIDSDLGNQSTEYFTNVSGISYWNETFGQDSVIRVADLLDTDGDGTFSTTGTLPNYFGHALTSFPSVGSDAQGNLYLCYTAVAEGFYSDAADAMYRHIFLTKSSNGGLNWSSPYDVINKDYVDEDLLPFMEAVYPSIARLVDDKIHLVYQQDYAPDAAVINTSVPVTDNNIVYLGVDKNVIVANKDLSIQFEPLTIQPNPVHTFSTVTFTSANGQNAVLKIIGMDGITAVESKVNNITDGVNILKLDTNTLPAGLYQVLVIQGNIQHFGKFIKQ